MTILQWEVRTQQAAFGEFLLEKLKLFWRMITSTHSSSRLIIIFSPQKHPAGGLIRYSIIYNYIQCH